MPHPDHVWLADILIAARHVRRFVEGVTREDLEADEMRISAVIQKLEIMGEAAKNVSAEFKSVHPTIPWKAMAGMRDVLIHSYRSVNPDLVWKAVSESVPKLIVEVEPLLPDL